MAYLLLGRLAPPELSHAHRLKTMLIGILQQLRCTTVTRPSRRHSMNGVAENVNEVTLLTEGIKHPVATEQPLLQLVAHIATTVAQGSKTLLMLLYRLTHSGKHGVALLSEPTLFCLQKLTLAHHCRLLFCRQGFPTLLSLTPTSIAPSLSPNNLQTHLFQSYLYGLFRIFIKRKMGFIVVRFHEGFYLFVDGRDFSFSHLEMPVGLLCVEHRRHKIIPVVASGKQSRVSSKEAQLPVMTIGAFTFHFSLITSPYHKHAEHLARTLLPLPYSRLLYILLHQLGSSHTKRMRLITEGISKLPGRLY